MSGNVRVRTDICQFETRGTHAARGHRSARYIRVSVCLKFCVSAISSVSVRGHVSWGSCQLGIMSVGDHVPRVACTGTAEREDVACDQLVLELRNLNVLKPPPLH